jgi:hypothetical protein
MITEVGDTYDNFKRRQIAKAKQEYDKEWNDDAKKRPRLVQKRRVPIGMIEMKQSYAVSRSMTLAISSAQRTALSRCRASTITRNTGSVPEARINTLP